MDERSQDDTTEYAACNTVNIFYLQGIWQYNVTSVLTSVVDVINHEAIKSAPFIVWFYLREIDLAGVDLMLFEREAIRNERLR